MLRREAKQTGGGEGLSLGGDAVGIVEKRESSIVQSASHSRSRRPECRPTRGLLGLGVRIRVVCLNDKSENGRTVDALASAGDEGRGRLRKAAGSRQTGFDPQVSEWGNPAGLNGRLLYGEFIAVQGKRGELKHLSTRRRRHHTGFSQ